MRPFRELKVPDAAAGMRLDRFLARRFADRTRSWLARGIRAGEVCDADHRPLRASFRLQGGELLHLFLPGIAPSGAPPPLPPILYEDDRLVVLDKPPGMLAHPVGTHFAWAVIQLARRHWPADRMDLVHRLDRETSGAIVLSRDPEANRALKASFKAGEVHKEYRALCRGVIPWEERLLDGPIGEAGGEIRIQMAVRQDGMAARTVVQVLQRSKDLTKVRCVLHTGRTHQIRVHLAHAGFPILGDRMYGQPPETFLRALELGHDHPEIIQAAGAPRHALHAHRVVLPHPDGHALEVEAPWPADLRRWWEDPTVLPLDRAAA